MSIGYKLQHSNSGRVWLRWTTTGDIPHQPSQRKKAHVPHESWCDASPLLAWASKVCIQLITTMLITGGEESYQSFHHILLMFFIFLTSGACGVDQDHTGNSFILGWNETSPSVQLIVRHSTINPSFSKRADMYSGYWLMTSFIKLSVWQYSNI